MRKWLVACAALMLAVRLCGGGGPDEAARPARPARPGRVRIATFNIEHFPKDARQVTGAFDEITALDADLVAAEEITDVPLFVSTARARLGARWDFVRDPDRFEDDHHIGVLFDRDAWRLVSSTVHSETCIGRYDLPVLEVRLAPVAGGELVRVLVVHLRPLTRGRPVRAQQLAMLGRIAQGARASGERVVVLGDFNATEYADRDDLATLARTADLQWATEDLACSAFWRRAADCPRSRLDHVLTSERPTRMEARGACATDGCAWADRCPLWATEVSDHCPVLVDF